MSLREPVSYNKGFWNPVGFYGLVQQKGPWPDQKIDKQKRQKQPLPVGVVGKGGTLHAGHNYWELDTAYMSDIHTLGDTGSLKYHTAPKLIEGQPFVGGGVKLQKRKQKRQTFDSIIKTYAEQLGEFLGKSNLFAPNFSSKPEHTIEAEGSTSTPTISTPGSSILSPASDISMASPPIVSPTIDVPPPIIIDELPPVYERRPFYGLSPTEYSPLPGYRSPSYHTASSNSSMMPSSRSGSNTTIDTINNDLDFITINDDLPVPPPLVEPTVDDNGVIDLTGPDVIDLTSPVRDPTVIFTHIDPNIDYVARFTNFPDAWDFFRQHGNRDRVQFTNPEFNEYAQTQAAINLSTGYDMWGYPHEISPQSVVSSNSTLSPIVVADNIVDARRNPNRTVRRPAIVESPVSQTTTNVNSTNSSLPVSPVVPPSTGRVNSNSVSSRTRSQTRNRQPGRNPNGVNPRGRVNPNLRVDTSVASRTRSQTNNTQPRRSPNGVNSRVSPSNIIEGRGRRSTRNPNPNYG